MGIAAFRFQREQGFFAAVGGELLEVLQGDFALLKRGPNHEAAGFNRLQPSQNLGLVQVHFMAGDHVREGFPIGMVNFEPVQDS